MLILLDLETGGLNPKQNPILQGFFMVTDEKLSVIKEYEFYVKPSTIPEHLKNIDKESVEVNKLDLDWMEQNGIEYERAMQDILGLFREYPQASPVGYNVLFDIEFLKANIKELDEVMSHKYIDIYSVVNFLKFCDVLSPSAGSLSSVGRLLGVSPLSDLHNAKYDVYYLKDVMLKLIEEVRLRTSNVLGLNPEDVDRILMHLHM